MLGILADYFGIDSRTEIDFPSHVVLSRGTDIIAVNAHPSAYDKTKSEVFSPCITDRILRRYGISPEDFRAAYNRHCHAA